MEIIAGSTQFQLHQETAVAIGKFDGVHIGHQKLLERILQQKQNGRKACVFTFDPAPAVFFGKSDGKELTVREEKRRILQEMGVDILIEYPMNAQTAGIQPEQFIEEVLIRQMKMRYLAAGADLSFGAGGKGNVAMLKKYAAVHGSTVEIVDKVCLNGQDVSSTYIREVLERADMELAEHLMGRPYRIQGTVVHGRKLGRTVGMPTLNQLPPTGKIMPPCGVYASVVMYEGREYAGISNIGYKPTVSSEPVLGIETHLFDFTGEIYGEEITVALKRFRRPEKRFDSLEELKKQIDEDISWAKSL